MPTRDNEDKEFYRDIERDAKGRFVNQGKQFDALKNKAAQFNKVIKEQGTDLRTITTAMNAYHKMIGGLNERLNSVTSAFQKQSQQIQQHFQHISKLGSGYQSLTASLLKSAAAMAVFYKAWGMVEASMKARLSGVFLAGQSGISAMRGYLPGGVSETRGLGMLGALFQNPALRYGARNATIQASGRLAGAFKGLGEQGQDLVSQYVKQLEPQFQRQFVEAVNKGDIGKAIAGTANSRNIGVADELLNALDVLKNSQDPLISANLKLNQAMEKLTEAVEKLAVSLAGNSGVQSLLSFAAEHPIMSLLGAGAALKGGGALGGSLLRSGLPWAGRGIAGAGAAVAGSGLLLPAALVAAGTGLGLAFTGEPQGLYRDEKTRGEAEATTMKQIQKLKEVALAKGGTRGQIGANAADLSSFEMSHRRGTFSQLFGMNEYSDEDQRTIDNMRRSFAELQQQLVAVDEATKKTNDELQKYRDQAAKTDDLRLKAGVAGARAGLAGTGLEAALLKPYQNIATQLTPAEQAFQDAILTQIAALQNVLGNIDTNTDEGKKEAAETKAEIEKLRNQTGSLHVQEYNLMQKDYSDMLELSRLSYQEAITGPVGIMGGLQQLDELLGSINKEIERQQAQLAGIDTSTTEGARLAREQELSIKKLQVERRSMQTQAMQAMLDQTLQTASNVGTFSKIILAKDFNLGGGLQTGAYNPNLMSGKMGYITGHAGRSELSPVAPQEWYRERGGSYTSMSPKTSNSQDPRAHLKQAAESILKAIETFPEPKQENTRLTNRNVNMIPSM